MYDWGIFSSTKFKTPMIGVGNLSVGGSGKSPMVMYLADYLAKNFRTGVLSRGYGRKTKGYVIVNYDSNFKMVGDEARKGADTNMYNGDGDQCTNGVRFCNLVSSRFDCVSIADRTVLSNDDLLLEIETFKRDGYLVYVSDF
jgi:hypothetical protein